jgi:sulfite oxidase
LVQNYPEKKAQAEEILAKYDFPPPPEFQLKPLPDTNPVLEGVRWKQYHYAMGNSLKDIPQIRYDDAKSMSPVA